ncbi:MAG: SelL-related redox protein [Gemmatimonadota bacterium]
MLSETLALPRVPPADRAQRERLPALIAAATDQDGRTLEDLSRERPVLLVFLRHLGCTFCREAAADVAAQRAAIEREGVTPAFVAMSREPDLAGFLAAYGLGDLPRFSDPDRELYAAFGLGRGTPRQLLGAKVVRRGIAASAPRWLGGEGHGLGGMKGDGLQMPGVFLVHRGRVIGGYRHETAADRPDYGSLACEAR